MIYYFKISIAICDGCGAEVTYRDQTEKSVKKSLRRRGWVIGEEQSKCNSCTAYE
jgi:hypothetical protein